MRRAKVMPLHTHVRLTPNILFRLLARGMVCLPLSASTTDLGVLVGRWQIQGLFVLTQVPRHRPQTSGEGGLWNRTTNAAGTIDDWTTVKAINPITAPRTQELILTANNDYLSAYIFSWRVVILTVGAF